MSADTGAQKLATIFLPMLKELQSELKAHISAEVQTVLIAVGTVESRVETLEKLVGGMKKTTSRGEKKAATTETAPTLAIEGAAETIKQPEGAQTHFFMNKLLYFKAMFRENAEFRNEYLPPDLKEKIENDPSVVSKKGEVQKLNAQATICYNHLKGADPVKFKKIEEDYNEAKKAHGTTKKNSEVQTPEVHTP